MRENKTTQRELKITSVNGTQCKKGLTTKNISVAGQKAGFFARALLLCRSFLVSVTFARGTRATGDTFCPT